jgi:hypothetical protein
VSFAPKCGQSQPLPLPQLLKKMSKKTAKLKSERSDFLLLMGAKINALCCFLKATYS